MRESGREPCPFCGGSGQRSSFLGVSRFLLTVEECQECAGLGYLPQPETASPAPSAPRVAAGQDPEEDQAGS
ncbi:MAG: hypothetical protein M0T76_08260 [Desulfobacteraceae bacterium]|nr:hypothetical protein [Desulfobacteraceae bacterium]